MALDKSTAVLAEIRRIRSAAKRPAKVRIQTARIEWDADSIALLHELDVDLRSAAGADRLDFSVSDGQLSVHADFAEEPPRPGDAPA
jgi:hypothetical protein